MVFYYKTCKYTIEEREKKGFRLNPCVLVTVSSEIIGLELQLVCASNFAVSYFKRTVCEFARADIRKNPTERVHIGTTQMQPRREQGQWGNVHSSTFRWSGILFRGSIYAMVVIRSEGIIEPSGCTLIFPRSWDGPNLDGRQTSGRIVPGIN